MTLDQTPPEGSDILSSTEGKILGDDFLLGGGTVGALLRARDWSGSALGPPQSWPQSLRSSVSTCLNSTFPIVVWWGPELLMLYNDAYSSLLGAARHPQALGAPARETWSEAWDTLGPMLEGVMARGEAIRFDDQPSATAPEERYFTFTHIPIWSETDTIGGVFTTVTETTQRVLEERRVRQEARTALMESEERYAAIFNQAAGGIAYTDLTGHFTLANDRYCAMLGRTREEVVGRTMQEFTHPEDLPRNLELFQAAIETGRSFTIEKRYLRPDGSVIWVHNEVSAIHDANGEPVGALAVSRDISKQKDAQERLAKVTAQSEKQKRLYEAIISSTPDLVYVFDRDYRFTFANDALLEMWGRTLEESLGKRLLEIGYEPWHAAMHEREIDQVVATRQPVRGEVPFRHSTQGWRTYEYIFVPVVNDSGEVEAIAGTTRDVTERKEAEEALRRFNETLEERIEERTAALVESREQLRRMAARLTMAEQEERRRISEILHDDLQQQLYGIQMKLTFVEQELSAGDVEMGLEDVLEAMEWIQHSIALTRQLTVDLSPPVLQSEGLGDMLRWLASQMQEMHGLKVLLESDAVPRIESDDMRVLLFQVVRELLFNVVKHASATQVRVELLNRDGRLLIRVSDDGRGFDMTQARLAVREEGGFGLFSIRERLRLFGGEMDIESQPGTGASVKVSVPL